ncbi:hypothetical protein EDB19DRAFT_1916994 [Suillus lakei]|nr:hypothetical protein EDB19DRAFT_1916994 [Suillus lakei]
MPNALMVFKADPTLCASWLQSYDALAVTIQDNLVITTPNMCFVPKFHHFEDENVQARADGRFGVLTAFNGLKPTTTSFAIPSAFPARRLTHSRTHFTGCGTLASDKVEGLESLLKLVDKRVQDWRANRQGKKDVIVNHVVSLRHGISQLKKHPLTFHNLLIFITDA